MHIFNSVKDATRFPELYANYFRFQERETLCGAVRTTERCSSAWVLERTCAL